MPSEMMDPKGFPSSSFFSDETHLPNEIQVGFWKTGSTPNRYGAKMDAGLQTAGRNSVHSSPQSLMSLESQLMKPVELPDSYLIRDHKANLSVEKHAIGAERAASYSLRRPIDHHDLGTRSSLTGDQNSYNMQGDKIRANGAQCENGLFSSSLSEIFSRKLRLRTNNAPYGHSAGAAASHYEEEPFESLEEMEAQTIGNLLPNDDDLLSGVTDGLDYVGQPSVGEGIEELDLFSSVGGMEMGEDGFISGQRDLGLSGGNHNSQLREVAAEHPYGEIPSRTLFVRNINSNVEESDVRALFEQYGDISTLYTACKHRGFVMVSYYDIRAARTAKTALQNKPLRRRNLDIHFSIPKDNPSDKDIKQGTLVVFNPDSVSNEELRQTFGVYGEIKEIHESPYRSQKRYIEFYDIRSAEAALRALNLSDTGRKIIMLEPTRLGGVKRAIAVYHPEKEPDEFGPYPRQSSSPSNITTTYPGPFSNGGVASSRISSVRAPGSPFMENMFHHGISSSVPKAVPSLARVESLSGTSIFPEACHSPGQLKVEYHGAPNFHPHSLPEYCDGLTNSAASNSLGMAPNIGQFSRGSLNGHTLELNDAVFGGSGNKTRASPGQHYMWNTSPHPQPQGLMWPNSPTFFNGVRSPHPSQGLPPAHVLNGGLPINNHHVGSAPSPNHSLWDRRQTFGGETPESSGFHPASLGSMRISGNSPHHMDFASRTMFPHISGSCMDLSIPSKKVALLSPHQKCMMFPGRGQMIHSTSPYDSPTERGRARRNEGSSNQGDNKKLFELDIDRILRGEDTRTTLMIKNIPNKYTSKMLLNAIDENHRGTYNFIYLPIDFKNKCNVGYAFINMTEPSLIVPFYQAFNGKKWEKFNSEKVATLAYARIQGKDALVAHFQNSSLMNEDKRCRPILFNTDGPNAGDQVPFPMGAHIRSRPNKTRTVTSEENNQESSSTLSNGEENGDSSSGSGKDSD